MVSISHPSFPSFTTVVRLKTPSQFGLNRRGSTVTVNTTLNTRERYSLYYKDKDKKTEYVPHKEAYPLVVPQYEDRQRKEKEKLDRRMQYSLLYAPRGKH